MFARHAQLAAVCAIVFALVVVVSVQAAGLPQAMVA
jgi:hypothetical protein